MEIQIDNQQTNQPIEIKAIQSKAQAILNALDCPDGELSILIVDDHRMAELNQTYLQHEGPTNVISFSMREGDFGDINPQLIGDVAGTFINFALVNDGPVPAPGSYHR